MKPDDPDHVFRDSFMICLLGWLAVFALAWFLSGCTPTATVQHEVPQLDRLGEAVKKIVVQDCRRPTLAMPPIPQDVVLDIKGDRITANAGGELLLRYYSRARQLLKPDASQSSMPMPKP